MHGYPTKYQQINITIGIRNSSYVVFELLIIEDSFVDVPLPFNFDSPHVLDVRNGPTVLQCFM